MRICSSSLSHAAPQTLPLREAQAGAFRFQRGGLSPTGKGAASKAAVAKTTWEFESLTLRQDLTTMQMQVRGLLLVDSLRQLGLFNTVGRHWSMICLERWLNWQKHLAGNEMGLKPHARSERVLSANLMPGRPIGRTLPLEGSSCQFEPGTGNQRRFHWRVAQSVVHSALTRKVGGSYPPSPAILRQQKDSRKDESVQNR